MTTISQKIYPGDLTEAQAELLLPLVPPPKPGGRPRSVNILCVINAIFYVLCTVRGKTPEMVRKEIYVYLLAYNLLRTVMWQAGTQKGVNPLRISMPRNSSPFP